MNRQSKAEVIQMEESLLSKSAIKNTRLRYQKDRTVAEKMAKWFLAVGASGRIITAEEIGKELLRHSNEGKVVRRSDVTATISNMREVLEINNNKSIWNVRGEGWKLASEHEKAVHLIREARTTIKRANRCNRLFLIVDKKELPKAIGKVFGTSQKAISEIRSYNERSKELFGKQLLGGNMRLLK